LGNPGAATVCTISLASGHGTCTLAAAKFPPGTTRLTATYNGSTDFSASTSAAKTLTVARAPSKTALSLSAANGDSCGGEVTPEGPSASRHAASRQENKLPARPQMAAGLEKQWPRTRS
jgi:hypothetical protein